MQLKIVWTLSIFLLFIFKAQAEEMLLCHVTNDIDKDEGRIIYEMDEDGRKILHLYQDSYHDGVRSARIELRASELRQGIVLNRKDKYITVRMHSDNFDETGGVLYLDTLYSGVSGERKEYVLEMAINKSRPELIQNKVPFNKMKFIAKRSRVLGVIGIEKVLFAN